MQSPFSQNEALPSLRWVCKCKVSTSSNEGPSLVYCSYVVVMVVVRGTISQATASAIRTMTFRVKDTP